MDLRNQSRNHSWSITAQLTKTFSDRLEARAAYAHTVVRDVQSLTGSVDRPFELWSGSRPLAGRHDDLSTGVSSFDVPHRVVLAATYSAPWKRWATDVSIYYIGESATPFTYLDSSATAGFGDLNADGTSANDPIYVPRNAADTAEIMFAGGSEDVVRQQTAFERFIEASTCLRRQRGRIVARNSCTGPWLSTSNLSLRQSLPAVRGYRGALQLDVFNMLNLMNPRWGLMRVPNVNVLQHVGQTAGAADVSRSIFRFDPALQPYGVANVESAYQLQLALRLSF